MKAHPSTPRSSLRSLGVNVAKLGAAGMTIFAAAAVMVIASPQGEVPTAEADIAMLDFGPLNPDQEFASALNKLGHEPPRAFDYNGNTVYFSTRVSAKRPNELLREYQEEFVRQGVNDHIFTEKDLFNIRSIVLPDDATPEQEEAANRRAEAILTGQLVPIESNKERMAMLGALFDGRPTTGEKLQEMMDAKAKSGKQQLFVDALNSHRYIQADWDDEQKVSFITASWGDENFDIRKTLPKEVGGIDEGTNPDPNIPSCPGCERLTRFAGTSEEAPFVSHIFASDQHPNTVLNFYQRALGQRGWTETEGSTLLQKALPNLEFKGKDQISRQFTRNKTEFLSLTIQVDPVDNRTYVNLQNSN